MKEPSSHFCQYGERIVNILACLKAGVILMVTSLLVLATSPSLAADGFGGNATGGAGGVAVTVTTEAELVAYAQSSSPYTITIAGTISLSGTLGIAANKTITGLDTNSTIDGELQISTTNVIVKNLRITNLRPIGSGDGVRVLGGTNVWVNHCTFFNTADGACDVTLLSDMVTVSWCKFYYTDPAQPHRFTMIGGNDPTGMVHLTLHHNWWAENCDQRMPAGDHNRVHIYNNYWTCTGNSYCSGIGPLGQMLSENNYYNTVNSPVGNNDGALLAVSGNAYVNCTGNISPGTDNVFTPPYAYSLEPTANVPSIVMAGSGNTLGVGSAPPAIPTGLAATAGNNQVSLIWSTAPFAASYNIKRATVSGGPYSTIGNSIGTSFTDNTAVNGTTYYYVASAVNVNGENANSTQVGGAPAAVVRIQSESFTSQSGVQTEACSDTGGGLNVGYINNGDWCSYANLDFGAGSTLFKARVASAGAGGNIQIRLGSTSGQLIGTIAVPNSSGWQTWTTVSTPISVAGVQTVYLVYTGGSGYLFNFNWFEYTVGGSSTPVPAAPSGLAVSAVSSSQVNLTWTDNANNEVGFKIERSSDDATFTQLALVGAGTTSYSDGGLAGGATYYYRVRAYNDGGESAASAAGTTTPPVMSAPATPTGLAATPASSSQINLTWNSSSGATSYNVKRAMGSGGQYATIATGVTGTSYNDTDLISGRTYYYVVSAVNVGGESANSAEISAAPLALVRVEAENFSSQSGVQTEACSDTGGGLDVGYINNGDWCSYANVDFGTGSSVFKARVASAGAGGNIEIRLDSVTGTLVGTVSVANTGGWQTWSTVSASMNASGSHTLYLVFTGGSGSLFNVNWFEHESGGSSPPSPPAAPTGLSATAGDNQVALSWTASSGATSYNVKRATVSGGPYSTIGSPTSPSYTDTTAVNGTTYYYVVSAVNSAGESANSTQASATPSCTLPSTPTGLSATAGDSQVALSWGAASGASSYNVKRATTSGGPYSTIASPIGTSYTDTTAVNGTTYYYVVSAVNPCGESSDSTQVSATPTAAPPAFVAAGAVSSGTATITPALPAGIASGDVLLLFVETANQAVSISNPNGGTWTEVTGSPQGTGTAAGASSTRLTVFWSRYNGTQGAPTVSDSGNHQLARMIAIRGAAASGNPWDGTAGGVEATSDTSGSIPGATTTVANTLVVVAVAGSLPDASGTANFSGWSNANLTSLTERTDNTVTAGNGGALGIATGVKGTAGAYGNTAVTHASSAVKGMISIAIKK